VSPFEKRKFFRENEVSLNVLVQRGNFLHKSSMDVQVPTSIFRYTYKSGFPEGHTYKTATAIVLYVWTQKIARRNRASNAARPASAICIAGGRVYNNKAYDRFVFTVVCSLCGSDSSYTGNNVS
jgi:hypothetical protein